jgi:acetyl-CoA carboxylase biotin carboxylase subunit
MVFKRVLVANRGEIACRIIRSLKEMGIESIAVYSESDRDSLPVAMADRAFPLGGSLPRDSYLNIPKLIEVIQKSQACGVHPGYGFLSESETFARAVAQETNARFIGPSPSAIALMGDKISAKKLMGAQNIPLVPGSLGALSDPRELQAMAQELGYPLILKACAGGGGRGMRLIHRQEEIPKAFEACQREAQNYFGDPSIFCERYIESPRHIEFQVLFDSQGSGVHLFERDCSIQRRHQKIFEEAPSAYLNPAQRARLGALSIEAARAANYEGVGTVEWICESPDRAYFMEMNTRIQVEHPVTEMICGVDLIAAQIRVAQGEPLPWKQEDLSIRGWAMEARINGEDPFRGFLPQTGDVTKLTWPGGPFVRVDSHLYQGYTLGDQYDSMIAKMIAWGTTREEARVRLLRALGEFTLEGFETTAPFHERLLKEEHFIRADLSTHYLESPHGKKLLSPKDPPDEWDLLERVLTYHQQKGRIPYGMESGPGI